MKEIVINKAVLADLDSILQIENLSFESDMFSRNQFIYLITRSKGAFFVAKFNDRVMGYISSLSNVRTKIVRIYSIAVHPDARGKNIAQSLINKTKEYTSQNHFSAIALEVKTTNTKAINLYKKNGFNILYVKNGYYADGSDAYYMKLNLFGN